MLTVEKFKVMLTHSNHPGYLNVALDANNENQSSQVQPAMRCVAHEEARSLGTLAPTAPQVGQQTTEQMP